MKIIKSKAKEIYTKTKLPGSDYVINQYVGCSHNCSYCYARFISRWKGYGEWGSWMEAKINAPELVKDKYVPGWVFMSSISDAYQPAEKDLKLTRKVLENMDKKIKLSILTKSDLVLRDIDLFKQFNEIEVGLTVNSFSGKEKKLFEPDSPTLKQRVEALKTLKENGIKTYAFVCPIIPGLMNLDEVIETVEDYADFFWFEFINLRGAGREFQDLLEKQYPNSFQVLKNKELLEKFVTETKEKISKYKIKVRGIEIH